MTPQLTPRERQCVDLVSEGRTDGYIAFELGISPRTARFHVGNARVKFGAANRPELVAKILKQEVAQ